MSGNNRSLITDQQGRVHALFIRHRSMSVVARKMGLSQIRVREALVQYQRNKIRELGIVPPSLREMMRGDVTTRFGVSRQEAGGRPAKHSQYDPAIAGDVSEVSVMHERPSVRAVHAPVGGTRRIIVTAVESGARVHLRFWRNLRAFAARLGAEILVLKLGAVGLIGEGAEGLRECVRTERLELAGLVDVAADASVSIQTPRPLDGMRRRSGAEWTIVPHWAIQLETLPRLRAEGLRIRMTTGCVSLPRNRAANAARDEVGAVVVEVTPDGRSHCRHLLADIDGDGSFQDLGIRVKDGVVSAGCRIEALTFGDVHHAHLDPQVASATWGIGARTSQDSLVDRLRPRTMVFHDVCDFDARNHHHARDHHRRFAQMVAGGGDVRAELEATSRFLGMTRRAWCRSVVVGSNHDEAFVRWLREADYRDDPLNAIFYLESSLTLHRRMLVGKSTDGMFEQTLRHLSADGLSGIRFLGKNESFKVVGNECAIHGHHGADGKRVGIDFFERLGIRATLGHTHRPTTRSGIYAAGVCQTEMDYARGPLTAWAVGHVVTYSTGARQHLILNKGSFVA